jgi:GT2 family glycosyltransferase
MYSKGLLKKIGGFNESLWTGEEYEFNLRALYFGCSIGYVNKVVYFYRIHQNQKSKEYECLRKEHINNFKKWYQS